MRVERILDADVNRAAEGLRVLEEVARFLGDDHTQAATLKHLRHRLRAAIPAAATAWRDTPGDVGTTIAAADEARRCDLVAIIRANARRAQEALRALEEFSKLSGLDAAFFEAMRYACYTAESELLARLPQQRLRAARLYALIDVALCDDPVAVAGAVAHGGAGVVQLRAKQLEPRNYLALAERMQAAVRAAGA
ncbi:MAG: thiamine phosphate synthase, partial [Planctomycetota bacterium]